jgi:ABC-2 type transport system permease protein
MNALLREGHFLAKSRAALGAVALLAVVAALAVCVGLADVQRQRAAIERALEFQVAEERAVQAYATEAGDAAYYSFLLTWNAPSSLAFAALGQRDVAPYMLRVRALALEGQLYENEAGNPELALPGRFDFAFVLVYLAPLVLIALLHDLVSGERERGRLPLLRALPGSIGRLWAARVAVRAGAVFVALGLPFMAGAAFGGATVTASATFLGLVGLAVAFWSGAVVFVATRGWNSPVNATVLAASWFVLTLVLPAAAHLAVNAAVPIPSGAELARENREAVHEAWDLPRQDTLDRFLDSHPQWAGTAALTPAFHWKWYFAFQQLGDQHVAGLARGYREGIARRDGFADAVGWALPPVGIQRALHRLAATDVRAQLEYLDRVRVFHAELRNHYYPFLFEDRPFGAAGYAGLPRFAGVLPRPGPGD